MSASVPLHAASDKRLDSGLISRSTLVLAIIFAMVAPFSPDLLAFGASGFVLWVALRCVMAPGLPAGLVFLVAYQWLQIFARLLVGMVDGESMARSVYGAWVENAWWYMMLSVLVLALAIRLVLPTGPPPTRELGAHLQWRPVDVFTVYLGAMLFHLGSGFVIKLAPALWAQILMASNFKVAAAFVLFAVVLQTGQGVGFLWLVIGIELVTGFSGLLSDFRGVFIHLAMAALAVRVRWTGRASTLAAAGTVFLLGLALFWTSVKQDYRDFATGGEDSQALAVSLDQRLGFIGGRATAIGNTDWAKAAYAFVNRLAYVDITGSVIAVQQIGDDHAPLRQWGEALSHVFQPRFLFPNKPALSDTEVFIRLTRANATETLRASTSISVGYIGENYVDLGFPGMLAGVFLVGLILGGAIRYFMTAPMPWVLREGTVLALIYSVGVNGIEASLPKILGATVMFSLIFGLLARYAYPKGIAWLDGRGRMCAEGAPAVAETPSQPADEPNAPFVPTPPDRPQRRAVLLSTSGAPSRPAGGSR